MGKVRFSHLALITVLIGLAFSIGYWRGQESILSIHQSSVLIVPSIKEPEQATQKIEDVLASEQLDAVSEPLMGSGPATPTKFNDTLPDPTSSELLIMLPHDASASELLEFLIQIANNDNSDNMRFFAKTMDRLRATVSDDPNAIQALLDNFMQAGDNAKGPYYIISVLQGSDIPNREQIFERLAQQLAADGSSNSQEKLLHLLSSTGLHEKNTSITGLLTDIALYADADTGNRLYALDLLMPYQLNQNQKQAIVNDLKLSINTMDEDQTSYAIENMMRFSGPIEREQMAKDFLDLNYDLSTRIAVLSSLHSGTVNPSGNLKTHLFTIAKDATDPLSKHAKHALMTVFDISNEEYKELNNGQ